MSNTVQGKVRVDDDFVWELANTIRWLSQILKEKFKIEKFIFGEIYANYHVNSAELVLSLMEELGYDNENDETINGSNQPASSQNTSTAMITSPVNFTNSQPTMKSSTSMDHGFAGRDFISSTNPCTTTTTTLTIFSSTVDNDADELKTPVKKAPVELSYVRDEANTTTTTCSLTFFRRVNSLFEDCGDAESNDMDSNDYDELAHLSQGNVVTNDERRRSLELLNEFKKKKL